ncbi:hypothetical protein JAAARDRAFT_120937 [Jaapia argillacea MUCL 33604]|uniref:DUF7721 domain-containing protein n=1 Tax=Jaapia argillacea MUCL 33604 TaxID=933084 RepID=A0A067QKY7_9AGAM|nr:hypothetical protein JAAARDRAFT_120937 [Jaapia argillacea MUCL 33604]
MVRIIALANLCRLIEPSSGGNVRRTGGHEYNSPDNSQQSSGGYQGGNGGPNIDHDEAVRTAQRHGSGGDSSLFSNALGFVNGNQGQHQEPVDEQHVQNAHKQAYEDGDTSSMSASSLGGAAAMQAFQKFTSGGGASGGGGGNMQTQLISMAMSEATKLFDSQGAASGNKQDAVNGAAMTVMKLLVQSKFSGATGGGNSGGLGSLMGLVSTVTSMF